MNGPAVGRTAGGPVEGELGPLDDTGPAGRWLISGPYRGGGVAVTGDCER